MGTIVFEFERASRSLAKTGSTRFDLAWFTLDVILLEAFWFGRGLASYCSMWFDLIWCIFVDRSPARSTL